MNQVVVSVIVICYNMEHYVAQCLDSIISQNFKEFEIILYDDCSSDGSRAIIEEYADRYPDLIRKVYPPENLFHKGFYKVLTEYTLPICMGEYVMFCEADDYWTDSNKMRNQYNLMLQNCHCVACVHDTNLFDAVQPKINFTIPNNKIAKRYSTVIPFDYFINDWIDEGTFFSMCSLMIRKDYLIPDIIPEFFKKSYCLDWTVMLLVAIHGDILYIKQTWTAKRMGNANSLSVRNRIDSEENRVIRMNELKRDITLLQLYDQYTMGQYHYQIMNSILKKKRKVPIYAQSVISKSAEKKLMVRFYQKIRWIFKNFFRKNKTLRTCYLFAENFYLNIKLNLRKN